MGNRIIHGVGVNALQPKRETLPAAPAITFAARLPEAPKDAFEKTAPPAPVPALTAPADGAPDRKWWKEAVVYQLYPRSFKDTNGDGVGDLRGVIEKLDYLKELGVDVVWLNPVYASPNEDNGYDVSDYRAINPEFGTMADMEELIDGLHQRGMKLIMDIVVNHSSSEHPWFKASRASKDNPYRDYYIWRPGKTGPNGEKLPPNNWGSIFGGSAWQYDPTTGEYYLHLFAKGQPDLNWENPKLREDVYQMMRWWLDKGVDGFRLDAIDLISKRPGLPPLDPKRQGLNDSRSYANGPRLHEFLKEMNAGVSAGRDVMTVAEWPSATPELAAKTTSPDAKEVDMLFTFEHMGLDVDRKKGRWAPKPYRLTDLKALITRWQTALDGKGWNSNFLSNHDHPRAISRFGTDREPWREASGKLLATLTLTLQGTPYVYMGEEIGMTNIAYDNLDDYEDITTRNFIREARAQGMPHDEIVRRVHHHSRDNGRTPMQWNDRQHGGFSTGKPWLKPNPNHKTINADDARQNPDSIFHYYKALIQLRKRTPALIYGKYELLAPEDENVFAYTRTLGNEKYLVVLNFAEQDTVFAPPVSMAGAKRLLGNYPPAPKKSPMQLKPYEARVYKLK